MADKTKAVTANDAGLKSNVKGNSAKNPSKGKGPDGTGTKETSQSLEEKLLSQLNCVLTNQKSAVSTMDKMEKTIDACSSRLKILEDNMEQVYSYVDSAFQCGDEGDSSDMGDQRKELGEFVDDLSSQPPAKKSRFDSMADRFKGREICDPPLDPSLAQNINNLFRNGMSEESYSQMTKDDYIPRPENCEALVTVKVNKPIWDVCSTQTKFIDKKLQNAETALIKGSILVAKAVHKLAEVESEVQEKFEDISQVIDQCNDALSLFGFTNKQINMTRRDVIKPELKSEYLQLCNPSVPFTSELFGDDLSKTTKDIEDMSRIGYKLNQTSRIKGFGQKRPSFRAPPPNWRNRVRPQNFGNKQGLSSGYGPSTGSNISKNFHRRGGQKLATYRQ